MDSAAIDAQREQLNVANFLKRIAGRRVDTSPRCERQPLVPRRAESNRPGLSGAPNLPHGPAIPFDDLLIRAHPSRRAAT
jgi:hypothetical protein